MNLKQLGIFAGILLLLAIPTGWPYIFYILLRWFTFVVASIISYGFYKSTIFSWALIFAGIAYLFNPIAPVYLSKSTWVSIDFICSIMFFLAAYSVKKNKQ